MVYQPKEISIVGAGLVGSLLSVVLGQRGYKVDIYERRGDMRRQEVGSGRSINLALSERGIFALEKAGLMEKVKPLLIPMRGRRLHLADGGDEFLPYGQRPEEVIFSVSRQELNALMMTAAEEHPDVNVRFERKCERIDFESNQLTLMNEDTNQTETINFEMIIGADGAGSRVRRAMIPVAEGVSHSDFLDHDYKELEIPAAEGGGFRIEKEALHIWPRGGFMLIALPNLDGSFTVTLFLPKSGNPGFGGLKTPDQVMKFFEEYFPSAIPLLPNLAEDFFDNPTGSLGTLRCSPWFYENDSLLVGDAAHAIVPFHGQGMNLGFEDCSELDRLLDEFDDDWEQVLPEFDRIRKPCADAIADMALENYITMRDSVREPKFQLKKEVGFELERLMPDRFIPRYSMVMFHRIPYDLVFERGTIQERILNTLVEGKETLDEVDIDRAKKMVEAELSQLDLS